ncbi:beta-ketoacyl synthase N-terminal-like domain-containing protein, partial [Testudinibacter aquarius]
MKRAVITGYGIISSIGNNKAEVLAALQQGKSGITSVPEFIEIGMRSHVAGTIKLNPAELIDRKVMRFMGDAAAYAYLSMQEAIEHAGLAAEQVSNDRTGLVIGAGTGSAHNQIVAADAMRGPRGVKAIGPYAVTKTMASSVSACLATPFKIRGVNYSISSACATSAHCIGHAVELIQLGKQDVVFAGGAEELAWECACEFDAMGALSTKYNDCPEKASRTYD